MAIAILGIVYAFVLRAQILSQDKGTPRMQEVWGFIKDGANAYLSRQFRTIIVLVAILTFVLGASVLIVPPTREAEEVFGENAVMVVAIGRAIAFLMGSLFSYTVGFVGMNVAVEANVRVAAAARKGYNPAMQTAYRSGTVTGMLTVGSWLAGRHADLHGVWHRRARCAAGLRLRRQPDRAVYARGRRHLHQGRRCGRRPGRQG